MYVPILTWILLTLENYALFTWNQNVTEGTSLVAQWLRIHASTAGGVGSIPGWGTKIPHVMQHGQNKTKKNYNEIPLHTH